MSAVSEPVATATTVGPARALSLAPELTPPQLRWIKLLRGIDGSMLLLSAALAVLLASQPAVGTRVLWAAGYAALTVGVLVGRGFYRFRLANSGFDAFPRIFSATSTAAMPFTLAAGALTNDLNLVRETLILWILSLGLLSAGRLAGTYAVRRSFRLRDTGLGTLIIGAGTIGQLLGSRLLERPELGLRPIGFLDKEPMPERAGGDGKLPVLGASWDLTSVIEKYGIQQVIVTFSTAPHAVLLGMIRECRRLGVQVAIVPRLFEEVSRRIEVEHLGGVPLLRASSVDPKGWQFSVKYVVDRVLASLALVALSPVLLALALAVRLSSPGPVIYRQPRVGLDGREFNMLKFRSMRDEASDIAFHPLEGLAPGGVEGIDRRTHIGRLMRRFSLDELLQFFNVLRGEMSLVGPRPERTSYVRSFEDQVYRYDDRHRVKSGLTGWAQVQGLRGQTSLSDRVEWDNYYIENWSIWLDLKIMFMTVPALFGAGSGE
jgi:exopolysaccharide biosynthesis polyprenyl glycosylphosphotransferase